MIIGILWFGLSTINSRTDAELVNKETRNNRVDYEIRLDNYQKDQARIKREVALLPGLRKDTETLEERREKAKELLDQFYSLEIIRPKYRSMVCVATFLEYLENERCYKLTGPDGCYNKFEDELRQGIIINQLTNISNQLAQIRQNQELLADALDEIQHNTNSLCSGL